MLRRSDFIAATYALSFVFANFGIAIAARMPMITTTIRSSISVKPFLLLIDDLLIGWWRRAAAVITQQTGRFAPPQPGSMAGRIPKPDWPVSSYVAVSCAAELKWSINPLGCNMQGQMHSTIHQLH